jgi:hypothetical protein
MRSATARQASSEGMHAAWRTFKESVKPSLTGGLNNDHQLLRRASEWLRQRSERLSDEALDLGNLVSDLVAMHAATHSLRTASVAQSDQRTSSG